MFGRNKREKDSSNDQLRQAETALEKSSSDYEFLQSLKPTAEETVRGHRKLQLENHFAERMWLAYRGEA
jgi:hypothetical protein